MDVLCESCKAKFKIADEKLPAGQTVTLKCPKCQNRIKIDSKGEAETTAPEAPAAGTSDAQAASYKYDASDKPFDYVAEGVETCLICEEDSGTKELIYSGLTGMQYQVTEADSAGQAVKYMRFHVFDLVVVNEAFGENVGSNPVLQYLSHLPMNVRRNIFVVLLGKDFRTGDNVFAFNKSVNLVVNLKNVADIEQILVRSLRENEEFYRVFKESMRKVGRT